MFKKLLKMINIFNLRVMKWVGGKIKKHHLDGLWWSGEARVNRRVCIYFVGA
jgi:hypothetical protein